MMNSYWFFFFLKLHFIQILHHNFAYSRLHLKFRNWIWLFLNSFPNDAQPSNTKSIRHLHNTLNLWLCDHVWNVPVFYLLLFSLMMIYQAAIRPSRVHLCRWAPSIEPDLHPVSLSSILPPKATLQASASANVQAQYSWRCWKCLMVLGGWISTKPVALAVFRMEYQHTALYILHIAYYFFLNSMWKCMQCAAF